MVEAIARLIPGVLGNPASAKGDSFSDGRWGACYTRPEVWRQPCGPRLRSGNTPLSPLATGPWGDATAVRGPDMWPRCHPVHGILADRALLGGARDPPGDSW